MMAIFVVISIITHLKVIANVQENLGFLHHNAMEPAFLLLKK
jgi:hypothetical protein